MEAPDHTVGGGVSAAAGGAMAGGALAAGKTGFEIGSLSGGPAGALSDQRLLSFLMKRKVFCTKYSKCLDAAIKEDREAWDCVGCKDFDEDKNISMADFFGCCLLLTRLFLESAYRQYVKEKYRGN